MISLDASALFALIFAAVLAGLLLGVLPPWRRLMSGGAELPIWKFLLNQGIRRADAEEEIGQRALRQAELRCFVCNARRECVRRLAAGAATPARDCPNAGLFPRA